MLQLSEKMSRLGTETAFEVLARAEALAREGERLYREGELGQRLCSLCRDDGGLLTEEDSDEFQGLMMATDNLESVADVIETDIVALAYKAAEIGTMDPRGTKVVTAGRTEK